MSYEFTKLSNVPAVSEFPEGANAIIETNGEIKRCSSAGGSSVPKPLTYDYMPEGYPSKTVQTITLMEEQEVAFALEGGAAPGEGTAYGELPALEIVEGKTYAVNWDGTEYECVCIALDTSLSLGNTYILGGPDDTGEPFAYYCDYTEGASYFATLDTAASHTISVKTAEETVTPMAAEFLPATVAEIKETAENAQTTANAAATKANPVFTGTFSQNRNANTVIGDYSHAEGYNTTASGRYSHAEGCRTKACSSYQHTQGKYNIEDSSNTYAHIVGNGDSDTSRSNAHTLDWSGNAWFAGTIEGAALIIPSSTEGSTKKFKITVDDSGIISATEVTT